MQVNVISIRTSHVESVYSGIDGKCCCGCAGTHFANPSIDTPNNSHRKPSKMMVKRVIVILRDAMAFDTESVDVNDGCLRSYAAVVIRNRVYIAYAVDGVEFVKESV